MNNLACLRPKYVYRIGSSNSYKTKKRCIYCSTCNKVLVYLSFIFCLIIELSIDLKTNFNKRISWKVKKNTLKLLDFFTYIIKIIMKIIYIYNNYDNIQSKPAIINFMGPSIFVRYTRDIVPTVMLYVVN